jgi:hypothetical protein
MIKAKAILNQHTDHNNRNAISIIKGFFNFYLMENHDGTHESLVPNREANNNVALEEGVQIRGYILGLPEGLYNINIYTKGITNYNLNYDIFNFINDRKEIKTDTDMLGYITTIESKNEFTPIEINLINKNISLINKYTIVGRSIGISKKIFSSCPPISDRRSVPTLSGTKRERERIEEPRNDNRDVLGSTNLSITNKNKNKKTKRRKIPLLNELRIEIDNQKSTTKEITDLQLENSILASGIIYYD